MPILQIRELPEHLYEKLKAVAKSEHRSIAQQALIALAKGLEIDADPVARRKAVLDELESFEIPDINFPDPVELIREDRTR